MAGPAPAGATTAAVASGPWPSQAAPAAPRSWTVTTGGDVTSLRFVHGSLEVCSRAGRVTMDLTTGRVSTIDPKCPSPQAANPGCGETGMDVEVQSPLDRADDVINLDGVAIPVSGRVHDCAAHGKRLAVVTGSAVAVIEGTNERLQPVSLDGGERVAIEAGWVAWSIGARVEARTIAAPLPEHNRSLGDFLVPSLTPRKNWPEPLLLRERTQIRWPRTQLASKKAPQMVSGATCRRC